jgi:hypothetical protein
MVWTIFKCMSMHHRIGCIKNILSFSFICMFCRSLFVLLCFLFWPLRCLFCFDIRIPIAPLVCSNSSYTFIFFIHPIRHIDERASELMLSTVTWASISAMSWPEQVFTWFVIRVTRRVIYVEQDLLCVLLFSWFISCICSEHIGAHN